MNSGPCYSNPEFEVRSLPVRYVWWEPAAFQWFPDNKFACASSYVPHANGLIKGNRQGAFCVKEEHRPRLTDVAGHRQGSSFQVPGPYVRIPGAGDDPVFSG